MYVELSNNALIMGKGLGSIPNNATLNPSTKKGTENL